MSELHAALGMVQLKRLPDWIISRRNVAAIYNKVFGESELVSKGKIILPIERDWAKHVYHLYVIRVLNGKRDELRKHLQNHGINTGIHYGKAIHEQPVIIEYLKNQFDETIYPDDYPETNKAIKEILSLPMHPELSVEDITRIVDSMKSFFRRN